MPHDHRRSLLAVGAVLAITGLFAWWTLADGGDDVDSEIRPADVPPATADRGPTTSVFVEPAAEAPTTTPTTAAAGQTVPTDSKVSLPAIGHVTSEWTQNFGPLWIVHHSDGTVTVLPGVVIRQAAADKFDVDGLASLVWRSSSGRSFVVGSDVFDEWGRAVDGPRSKDLAGLLGSIDGPVVNVSPTRADRIAGQPDRVAAASDLTPPSLPPSIGSAMTTDVPGWFVLDEWLVIVNGSGTLCDAERGLDCDPITGRVTAVTSSDTERTVWLPAPLIAHFDAAGSVDTAVSLGGVFPTSEPTIIEAGPSCGATDEATVRVRFSAPGPVDVIVEVRQGDTLIGTATASLTDDLPWKTVQVPVTVYVDADDPLAEIVIRSVDLPDEQLAVGTVDFSLDRRDFGCPI